MRSVPDPDRLLPWHRPTPVVPKGRYGGLKDPCVVFDGDRWHLFATGCHEGYRYDVVHAVAPHPRGPWTMLPPVELLGANCPGACAPGVVAEGARLHMYLQEAYNLFGGAVHHLVSDDGGMTFELAGVALRSVEGTGEAGLYDAHPGVVHGEKVLVYSGFDTIGQPDLYVARADEWDGPWERLGKILDHDQVACHNQRCDPDYEWGLEGAQLVELPDGRVLLNAVCFLPGGEVGSRQRIFFAVADDVRGPYTVLGPVIEPASYGGRGENGHGGVAVHDGRLYLYFQHRAGEGLPWLLSCATAPAAAVPDAATSGASAAAGAEAVA